MLVNYSSQ